MNYVSVYLSTSYTRLVKLVTMRMFTSSYCQLMHHHYDVYLLTAIAMDALFLRQNCNFYLNLAFSSVVQQLITKIIWKDITVGLQ